MYRRTTTVINRTGLHARPASQFTNAAKAFDSRISIRNLSLKEQDNTANAKSVLSVLGACIKSGDEIEFVCTGEDEEDALKGVVAAVENGLGE